MTEDHNFTGYRSPTTFSDISTASSRSVLDMPIEGSRRAPKRFKGDAAEVESFLRKYERLAASNNLSEREKCDTVLDYCGRTVRETIEGFRSYQQGNWAQLKEDIRIYWNADLESKQFRIKDLQKFVSQSQDDPILELKDWRQYLRSFVRIAGWLLGKERISNNDYAYYLWIGLHPSFRKRLEARILLEDPKHDMAKPFDPTAIDKAAKALLSMDRFDTERLGIRRSYRDQSDDEDSDCEEDERTQAGRYSPQPGRRAGRFDEEDDSDTDEPELRRRQLQKHGNSKQEKFRDGSSIRQTTQAPNHQSNEAELDALIGKLQTLSLDDPKYSVAYLKACRLDPNVERCFHSPILKPPARFSPDTRRDMPPHMGFQDTNRPPHRQMACYGCGDTGHPLRQCPQINEYLGKRLILKDHRGQITGPEGQRIPRQPGETIMQAIKRILPQVNFISYGGRVMDQEEQDSDTEEADVLVYPVERSQRETRSYRKKVETAQVQPTNRSKNRDPPTTRRDATAPRVPMQKLTPVETQPTTFNPDNDIEMIEDRTQVQGPRRNPNNTEPPAGDKPRWVPRVSEVSKTIDPAKIAEKLLDLPITLPVREIAGSSKEIASSLIDMLKLKKPEPTAATSISPTTHLVTTHTAPLIRLEMECNFKPVTFIVDTGSQLNIISEKVCKNIVRKPINTGEAITMNDANGGTGRLLGLVEDIPLKIGHVKTPINAFVSENPPFDGLLGRPWQQAHKIGIEEREDGTYLIFPDTHGYPKTELLVTCQSRSGGEPGVYSAIVNEWTVDEVTRMVTPVLAQDERIQELNNDEESDEIPDLITDSEDSSEDEDSCCPDLQDKLSPFINPDEDTTSEVSDESSNGDIDQELLENQPTTEDPDLVDLLERRIRTLTFHAHEVATTPTFNRLSWSGPITVTAPRSLMFYNTTGSDPPTFMLQNAIMHHNTGTFQGHILISPVKDSDEPQVTAHLGMMQYQHASRQPAYPYGYVPQYGPAPHYRHIPPPLPPLTTLRIQLGGVTYPFMLDTGSQIDCVHVNVFRAMGGTRRPLIRPYRIINAVGQPLPCLGIWRTSVTFGGIRSTVDLHIVENLTTPGILGQPWQQRNQFWMRNSSDGISVGVRSWDGRKTYEVLVSSPTAQQAAWNEGARMCALIHEDTPVINFAESHKLNDMMDTVRKDTGIQTDGTDTRLTQVLVEDVEAEPYVSVYQDPWDIDLTAPYEMAPSDLTVENRIYRDMLLKYMVDHRHDQLDTKPNIEHPEVVGADRFAINESWRIRKVKDEDLFLLRNFLIKVDGTYREGHAALHMVYFPHTTERVTEAEKAEQEAARKSSESLALSEHDSPSPWQSRGWPRLTQMDIEEFMDELEADEEFGHAQRWRIRTTPTTPPRSRKNSPEPDHLMEDTAKEEEQAYTQAQNQWEQQRQTRQNSPGHESITDDVSSVTLSDDNLSVISYGA